MQTEVDKAFTDPVYLVEIDFSSTRYFSSREEITYNSGSGSNVYLKDRLGAVGIRDSRASFSLANEDRFISALALTGQIRGNLVSIYLYYAGDAFLRFRGELDSFQMMDGNRGSWITFQVTAITALAARWPADRISPAMGLNHLPPPGLSFRYGTNLYILERAI
jgi:hypothetical protein